MSKGLGARQRGILANLAAHHDNPGWMTVRELAGLRPNDMHGNYASDIESTRRAVRKLEAAQLVKTRYIWPQGPHGQRQIGVRLAKPRASH